MTTELASTHCLRSSVGGEDGFLCAPGVQSQVLWERLKVKTFVLRERIKWQWPVALCKRSPFSVSRYGLLSTFRWVGLPRDSCSEPRLLESSFLLSPNSSLGPYLISAPCRGWHFMGCHLKPHVFLPSPRDPWHTQQKNSNCTCQEVRDSLSENPNLWAPFQAPEQRLPGILRLLEISDIVSCGPVFRNLWSKLFEIQETVVIYFLKELQGL